MRIRSRRSWKYTVAEIAVAADLGVYKVKKDRARGLFDPSSLRDVARYVWCHAGLRRSNAA